MEMQDPTMAEKAKAVISGLEEENDKLRKRLSKALEMLRGKMKQLEERGVAQNWRAFKRI